ncbi:GCN5-related N-acetyltransferase [Gloeothece citriformis PCC 7424]|uniref:GCN5-related N-acetyltransferase n=1 Tax=Gloeothece citriformis (strain PCC 7424) TaxID=65393 RepID=B7KIB7_GLOC7|nr:GNAT family N-acetyltransferase [Gloeothece citriformis]ACK73604.1 GCN5-related N-acetyltransferase [Gloeothece citriformis PCC 7424]
MEQVLLVEPCTIQHLETLLLGREVFFQQLGMAIADDYELSPKILDFSRKKLLDKTVFPCWWTHLFILNKTRTVIGIGGYKGNPDLEGMVEIGYSIAGSYQNQGLGKQAAKILIDRAFQNPTIKLVRAHTLRDDNPSVRLLKRVGMKKVTEVEDPKYGQVWRWEIYK